MPWRAQFRIHTRQRGPCLISPHLWDSRTFASDNFFDIEPQKRSRLTKLRAQTHLRVIQQFVPPSASKQSEITCARDKCVVFHNMGQAISGSTVCTSNLQLRLSFMTFPTDIALDFIIYRINVVFTVGSSAKYCTTLHTLILVITMKKWYLIFLLSQWCVLLTVEPGRSVMSATKTKNSDWNRTMAGLTGTATSR